MSLYASMTAQAQLEEKISELEETIRTAVVIKKDKNGLVGVGSTVEAEKNGKKDAQEKKIAEIEEYLALNIRQALVSSVPAN